MRTILLLLLFPFSLFYAAVYADSLYLLLATLSFYNARKARWFWAGFFGFLAGLTRLIGITFLPVLLLEWYLQNKKKGKFKQLLLLSYVKTFIKQRGFFLFIIPFGILCYALYLQIYHGNFLLFQKAMGDWGQDKFIFPLQVFYRYFKIMTSWKMEFPYFVAFIELLCTILYFALSIYVALRVRLSYGLMMFLTFLIPMFTGTFQSMPRYILHVFPGFIAIALLTSRSKKIFRIIALVFLILQFIFVALFTRGYFIA